MKNVIVFFNSYDYGSTGNLIDDLSKEFQSKSFETYFIVGNFPKGSKCSYSVASNFGILYKKIIYIFKKTGKIGLNCSKTINKKIVKFLKTKIDFANSNVIFHFNNMQCSLLNSYYLYQFAKDNNVRIFWTLHDCWAFTGGCNHFLMNRCENYKNYCVSCPKKIRGSKKFFLLKKEMSLYNNMTYISPSSWIDSLLHKSFPDCNSVLINNGIDASFWNFNSNKKIDSNHIKLLFVSAIWNKNKGLDIVNELADLLPDKYQIYLVGNKKDDKINEKIITLGILDKIRLKETYRNCDIFVNASLEDTFPTVNIEALLCGLPIVSFDSGGSKEIFDEQTGVICSEISARCIVDSIQKINLSHELMIKCFNRGIKFTKENFLSLYYNLMKD